LAERGNASRPDDDVRGARASSQGKPARRPAVYTDSRTRTANQSERRVSASGRKWPPNTTAGRPRRQSEAPTWLGQQRTPGDEGGRAGSKKKEGSQVLAAHLILLSCSPPDQIAENHLPRHHKAPLGEFQLRAHPSGAEIAKPSLCGRARLHFSSSETETLVNLDTYRTEKTIFIEN